MLTGRESLIRLVGKRRRFLPNRQSILSAPTQSCLSRNGGKSSMESLDDQTVGVLCLHEGTGDIVATVSAFDSVNCPVCASSIRNDDYTINIHLDTCLARGTKRKLTQVTLLQLNFCPRSKVQSSDSDYPETGLHEQSPNNDSLQKTVCEFSRIETAKENADHNCRTCLHSEIIQTSADDLTKELISPGRSSKKVGTLLHVSKHGTGSLAMAVTTDDISGTIIETFIVGRRFAVVGEVHPGASIVFVRDPSNVKDPNAIKVLSPEADCSKLLGFLPRELVQYLSPLVENYCLSLKGSVVSVPKHSAEAVPIQIICEKATHVGLRECDGVQSFAVLWENMMHVVESAKLCPPNIPKYQRNFSLLLEEVLRNDSHLFTEQEKIFLGSFAALSDDCQRLFIRLYTRKGPWFRMSNISYPEIMNSQEAVNGLSDAGYLCSIRSVSEVTHGHIMEILNLLSVSELREIFCLLGKKCGRAAKKQDYIMSILSSFRNGLCANLPNLIVEKTGNCVRISEAADTLIWRIERLFFLNGEQDLSAFLLVDLGIVKYPTYNCIITDHIFPIRHDLLAYEEAIEVAQIMDESLNENDKESVLRCVMISDSRMSSAKATPSLDFRPATMFFACFSASWVYSKVVLLGVSFLEQDHRYEDAINYLKRLLSCFPCDRRRGYWTLRLSIDLEHIGRVDESLSVAEDSLTDPMVRAGSRTALQRRILRLGKPPRRWKIPTFSDCIKKKIVEVHVQGRPLNCETGTKSRFYGEDGEQCGVEQLALQYYGGEGGGWQGVHSESGIWLTIFGILMWDVIFADLPNVFRNRFQTAPLDLETDGFYVSRKDQIEPHLQKIHDGMAEEILIVSWESHAGTACRGVSWDRHTLSELRAAVTCVGGPCLASICRHLSQGYRSWSSGMPDLLLWRFKEDYRGEAKLVEVKGPRDRLSEQQRAWLLFLMDTGLDVEVCKVSPRPPTSV